jgi:hypothetical protein
MEWVRTETPEDAVFAHWWDYGYWVQTMGNRATIVDGGNVIVYWNYLTGRLVLTGDNQADSLEFLHTHKATHLLIDSTDIGKYTAFSSIGSNENYDRYSWIPTMLSNDAQIQETKEGIRRIYSGGIGLDEDLTYSKNGEDIFLPSGKAGVGGIMIETTENEGKISFKQPEIIFVYEGRQINLPLRYIYFDDQFFDYEVGVEATAYIIQRVDQTNQGVQINELGALMYLSPRIMRGFLAQKYLLNDPFNNFPNFQIAHNEPSVIIESMRNQGMGVRDFVYFQGVQGPIKIWEINYKGNEKVNEEYLQKSPPESVTWKF